jgi:hypothetical protein
MMTSVVRECGFYDLLSGSPDQTRDYACRFGLSHKDHQSATIHRPAVPGPATITA